MVGEYFFSQAMMMSTVSWYSEIWPVAYRPANRPSATLACSKSSASLQLVSSWSASQAVRGRG